jgi:lipid-binding SYLF domain-containing protein
MNTKRHSNRTTTALFVMAVGILSALMLLSLARPASADGRQKTGQLVEKAQMTLQSFKDDSNMGAFRDLLKDARGALIFPQLLKGAFVFGASGGSGVLLVRGGDEGQWIGPAFYTLGSGSFGFQIGGEASEVVLLVMTDRGVTSLMSNSLKLGGEIGVAVGPVGGGVAASTANLSADILTFSRSKGLYGGIALDGAVVATRAGLNETYYGSRVTPTDIFVRRDVGANPQSRGLIDEISRMACSTRFGGKC